MSSPHAWALAAWTFARSAWTGSWSRVHARRCVVRLGCWPKRTEQPGTRNPQNPLPQTPEPQCDFFARQADAAPSGQGSRLKAGVRLV